MNDCTVTFEGDHGGTYTVSSDLVGYINDNLVNEGYNGTIYLYPEGVVEPTRYRYIALPQMQTPRFYSGTTSGYTYINNVHNVEFNMNSQIVRAKPYLDLGLTFLISLFVLVKMFSR